MQCRRQTDRLASWLDLEDEEGSKDRDSYIICLQVVDTAECTASGVAKHPALQQLAQATLGGHTSTEFRLQS